LARQITVRILRFILLCATLLAMPAPSLAQEAFLADKTYINDIYGFVLPIPARYTACTVPPLGSEHGFVLLLRQRDCKGTESAAQIGIDARWSNTIDASSAQADQESCGQAPAMQTQMKFGDQPLYRCANSSSSEREYFAIKVVRLGSKDTAVSYGISIRNADCTKTACERLIGPLLAGARFLSN
jgi:hypothetical protein